MIENRHTNLSDINVCTIGNNNDYILVSHWSDIYEQSVIQFINLTNKKIDHEWIPDLTQIYSSLDSLSKQVLIKYGRLNILNNGFDKSRVRLIHPLLIDDFSIVFTFMHGPLVCIDSLSNLTWVVNGDFHHSIEVDAEGNYWVPGVQYAGVFYEQFNIRDDIICKISPDGELLFSKSILDIFIENNLRAYEFGDYVIVEDLTHVNDIQPALTSTNYWNKGDLFISYRQGSTVFLYRPSTNEVLWMQRGPWLYQHDVDILDSCRISVFGNDAFYSSRGQAGEDGFYKWHLSENNEVYVYDFDQDSITTPYSNMFRDLKIRTAKEGRSEISPDGCIFVEETMLGRYLYFDKDSLHWQFGFKAPENHLLLPSWSRKIKLTENKTFIEE
jgi:hypothetical protein